MIPFAGSPLDRASEKRTDSNWIESKRRDPSSLVLPMWRLEPFILGSEKSGPPIQLGLVQAGIVDSFIDAGAVCIFLGLDGDRAVFAIDVSEAGDPANVGPLAGLGYFRDARVAASMVSLKDAAIIAQAKAMIDWHQRHGFCPRCGAATKIMDAGYRRLCGKCNANIFRASIRWSSCSRPMARRAWWDAASNFRPGCSRRWRALSSPAKRSRKRCVAS